MSSEDAASGLIADLDARLVELDDDCLDAADAEAASGVAPTREREPLDPARESADKEVP